MAGGEQREGAGRKEFSGQANRNSVTKMGDAGASLGGESEASAGNAEF